MGLDATQPEEKAHRSMLKERVISALKLFAALVVSAAPIPCALGAALQLFS